MAPRRTYTDTERTHVLDLHAKGVTRNAIMRETGYSARFISDTVADAGLTFARGAEVAAATQAKQIDNKARRATIIGRLYAQAEAVLDRLEQPTRYKTMVKGEKGVDIETVLDFIPPGDRRNELTSVGISLDKAVALEKIDTDNGAGQALSMLDRLAEQLQGVPLADLDLGGSEPEAAALPEDQ
ncbi:hypothetical protein GCM10023081_46880 [Arthrobacter ginkgonis]|uniref:Helix-turn-helix DNA binding domain protein n=1 Tax=Arthrobacter ginkgonis TaxID=1630594 RepID=A0ABP7DLP0_9MICC